MFLCRPNVTQGSMETRLTTVDDNLIAGYSRSVLLFLQNISQDHLVLFPILHEHLEGLFLPVCYFNPFTTVTMCLFLSMQET